MLENISTERLEEIEQERMEVMCDKSFQDWMKELNVSRSYSDPSPRINALYMMQGYDYRSKSKLDKITELLTFN